MYLYGWVAGTVGVFVWVGSRHCWAKRGPLTVDAVFLFFFKVKVLQTF